MSGRRKALVLWKLIYLLRSSEGASGQPFQFLAPEFNSSHVVAWQNCPEAEQTF